VIKANDAGWTDVAMVSETQFRHTNLDNILISGPNMADNETIPACDRDIELTRIIFDQTEKKLFSPPVGVRIRGTFLARRDLLSE
jgi:hypothetical protein